MGGLILDSKADAIFPGGLVYIRSKHEADEVAKQIAKATGLHAQVFEMTALSMAEWLKLNNHTLLDAALSKKAS